MNDRWFYNGSQIEATKYFTYLGMVFSSGDSFSENQKKITGQAQKAIFSLQNMTISSVTCIVIYLRNSYHRYYMLRKGSVGF